MLRNYSHVAGRRAGRNPEFLEKIFFQICPFIIFLRIDVVLF